MTIRIAPQITPLDNKRLAAVVTSAVVNPAENEGNRRVAPRKPGSQWVSWGDMQAKLAEQLD